MRVSSTASSRRQRDGCPAVDDLLGARKTAPATRAKQKARANSPDRDGSRSPLVDRTRSGTQAEKDRDAPRASGQQNRSRSGGRSGTDRRQADDSKRQNSSASVEETTSVEAKEANKKSEKEFAWMDSDEDDEAKSPASEREQSPELADIPTSKIVSFGQMVKMAPKLQASCRTMSMEELAAVCSAVARAKFYDASLMDPLTLAIKRHLRARGQQFKPEELVAVFAGLAEVNAYEKQLFELLEQALSECNRAAIHGAMKVAILKAAKQVNYSSERLFLKRIAEEAGKERYDSACQKVLTAWQRRDDTMKKSDFWWT